MGIQYWGYGIIPELGIMLKSCLEPNLPHKEEERCAWLQRAPALCCVLLICCGESPGQPGRLLGLPRAHDVVGSVPVEAVSRNRRGSWCFNLCWGQ